MDIFTKKHGYTVGLVRDDSVTIITRWTRDGIRLNVGRCGAHEPATEDWSDEQ